MSRVSPSTTAAALIFGTFSVGLVAPAADAIPVTGSVAITSTAPQSAVQIAYVGEGFAKAGNLGKAREVAATLSGGPRDLVMRQIWISQTRATTATASKLSYAP